MPEIRAEALDVYYGTNTFALIGDDSSRATKTLAMANRVAADDWMKLIGDDAQYLRKVRLLLHDGHGHASFLISVASNSNGNEPTVTVLPGQRIPSGYATGVAKQLEGIIRKHLAETSDMGKVWHAVLERALYSAWFVNSIFNFDISDEGIAKAQANSPARKLCSRATATAKFPTNVYTPPVRKAVAPKLPAEPVYDFDCMEVEAPARTTEAVPKAQHEHSEVMEIEAPAKKTKAGKKTKAAKKSKTVKQMKAVKAAEEDPKAGPSAEGISKPATRASTRKRKPRELRAE